MTMISPGGIIGAGLFVGTGPILNAAGPATILTHLSTGCILILIMRMLGEMAVALPTVGSFSDHGRMALGNWAGFAIGWLYWHFWAIVLGFEATVAAGIIGQYITMIPPWLISLILVLLLTATNLYSVGSYGESEFWFAGIKVAAIVLFIVLGALFVIPDQRPLLIANIISLGVILGAYLLRRQFGPPEKSPTEIIREDDTASS